MLRKCLHAAAFSLDDSLSVQYFDSGSSQTIVGDGRLTRMQANMGGSSSRDKERDTTHDKNLRFYRNEIYSASFFGYTIEDMLNWEGDYSKLENKHDYIQWLFPIPDSRGMNSSAQQLFEEEAKAIREDEQASDRVLAAYKMMLDFYGMSLQCETNGDVRRRRKFQERYDNLNRYIHNFRRITRILISLGELGYERFQVPWVTFLLKEVIDNKLPKVDDSCIAYWIDAIKDMDERSKLQQIYFACKTEGDNTGLHCIPTKVDEHVHTPAHGAVCSHYRSEFHENCIEDNKGINMKTANNPTISKLPMKNETFRQCGHNHSHTFKATEGFENSEMDIASSSIRIYEERSLSKPKKHISDVSYTDGVRKSDTSNVTDHPTDYICADGMKNLKTIPVQCSFVNGEVSASSESHRDSDITTGHARSVTGYNAPCVNSHRIQPV